MKKNERESGQEEREGKKTDRGKINKNRVSESTLIIRKEEREIPGLRDKLLTALALSPPQPDIISPKPVYSKIQMDCE